MVPLRCRPQFRGESVHGSDRHRDRVLQELKSGVQINRLMEFNIGKLILRGRSPRVAEIADTLNQRLFRAAASAPRARGRNRRVLQPTEETFDPETGEISALIQPARHFNIKTAPTGAVAMPVRQHPGRL